MLGRQIEWHERLTSLDARMESLKAFTGDAVPDAFFAFASKSAQTINTPGPRSLRHRIQSAGRRPSAPPLRCSKVPNSIKL